MGKYQLLTRLAVGGMAEIFLAVVSGPGGFRKFVTLKRILPQLREQEEFVRMFLDEARISAALSHANIAQVFDLGFEAGELFIAMEFVAGRNLGQVVRECKKRGAPVPLGFSAMVVRDVCLALHHAHHFIGADGAPSPIIHRDVSPNNVMLSYNGAVKVIDFGVAKARGGLGKTGEGAIKGSNGYMSPEQVRGRDLDGRSDLFAAGTVLHELLCGQPLFVRQMDLQTLRAVLKDEIPSPRRQNPGVPAKLEEVVMRALSRDPRLRFSSGREMARALEDAVPALIYDETKASAFMCELFPEHTRRTRALFELSDPKVDPRSLLEAAAGLQDDSQGSEPTPSRDGNTGEQRPYRTGVMHLEAPPPTPELLATTPPPPAPLPSRPAPSLEPAGARPLVLVVDDSEISQQFVEAHLHGAGFDVVCANSGEEALTQMDRRTPDLALLDLVMPGIDGFTLCRMIRERPQWRSLPIVFLSSACSLEERLKGLTVGGDDFVRKPYDPGELLARIQAHLQRVAFLRQMSAAPKSA